MAEYGSEPIVTANSRGHALATYDGCTWVYLDDGSPYDDTRECTRCDMAPAYWQAPDPCLERLPGVNFACCGHGDSRFEYVSANGVRYGSVSEWRNCRHG